jgi:TRAP-type C4-dicarboxylate transport system substrate-binding protein
MPQTLSRRVFLDLAAAYGARAAFGATVVVAQTGILPGTDWLLGEARAQSNKGKYRIRFGAGVVSKANELHLQTGLYEFVKKAEELSGGELEFQIIDSSQACNESTCGERVASQVIDMGNSSPQNMGSTFPYAIAMDFPFLWKDRTGYINFMYSKDSNKLYRNVLREAYGIEPLWVSGEMRNIFLGQKYKGREAITSFKEFQGAKVRITNSVMIANFMRSIGVNPIPLAWSETLEGLKSGVVDGAETWPGAATGFGMHRVLSHDVPLEFCVGCELFYISRATFQKLPTKLQEVMLEASLHAMQIGYSGVDLARNKYIGNGRNAEASAAYKEVDIKVAALSEAQLSEFKQAAALERNASLWGPARQTLDKVGGFDVYSALKDAAGRHNGKPHMPQKWWS